MKKVINNAAVPKGGKFIYVNAEDGYQLSHPYYGQLKTWVVDYRRLNNFPIGLQFDDEFEENVCSHADPITCEDLAPPGPFQKAARLAIALVKSAKSGFKVVSPEQLQARFDICGVCNYFRGNNGILKVACAKCGCSAKKLSLASENCPIGRW